MSRVLAAFSDIHIKEFTIEVLEWITRQKAML